MRLAGWLCLLLLSVAGNAFAEASAGAAPSAAPASYLTLTIEGRGLGGEWRLPVAELASGLGLPAGETPGWDQLQDRREYIEGLLRAHLKVGAGGSVLEWRFTQLQYGSQDGVPYIAAELASTAAAPVQHVAIDPAVLLTPAAGSRCLVQVVWTGAGMHKGTLTADGPPLAFERATAARSGLLLSLVQGIWHIWTGYDHILFLITLLIPSVFQRVGAGREAVPRFGGALLRVVVIVSAFTLAHSITLTCAALHWVSLPSRLVESAIAFSIFVAALFNFLPTTAGGRGAWIAFGFGLLHGFGFAGALSELGSQGGSAWHTIAGFNLGVECGQLAIVALFLPLAFLLRETRFYRTGVIYGGSGAAAVLALFWFFQRALF